MIECNCMIPVMNYGSSASYKAEPTPEQIANGVIPLDSLPAAWWNCMWSQTNTAVNQARDELGQLITELNNVLCNAGVCPQDTCTDQLYQSINKIRQTLANATTAGAVKSSSEPSEVSVNQTTGIMTVNCLGNAASLTTTARTVVGAVNELKSTYDCCFTDVGTAMGGKAPTAHASTATTYGVGNADCYGHLKISDTYTSVLSACSGVAASQMAVACVYCYAAGVAAGVAALGNTNGCALGTAAAGTASTAARSDHVHPYPTYVECLRDATNSSCYSRMNYGAAGITNPVWLAGWNGYELRAVCRASLCVGCAGYATSAGSATTAGSVSRATFGDKDNGTHDANCMKSNGMWYYTSNGPATSLGASTADGAMYSQAYLGNSCWVGQIAQDYRNGNLFVRAMCGTTWTNWQAIVAKCMLGNAAYCNTTAFRSNTWYPDSWLCGCVKEACAARGICGTSFIPFARYAKDGIGPAVVISSCASSTQHPIIYYSCTGGCQYFCQLELRHCNTAGTAYPVCIRTCYQGGSQHFYYKILNPSVFCSGCIVEQQVTSQLAITCTCIGKLKGSSCACILVQYVSACADVPDPWNYDISYPLIYKAR